MKRKIIAAATFVFGFLYFLEYVVPTKYQTIQGVPILTKAMPPVSDFLVIVLVFSLGLGWANLLGSQWNKLRTGAEGGRTPALLFFLSTLVTLVLGFWYSEIERGPHGAQLLSSSGDLSWLFKTWGILRDQVLGALGASVFSLLAFYIASAAYRAFKVRSLDAGLMMASAVIVMMGNVPIGNAITHGLANVRHGAFTIPTWAIWLMNNVNTPASRAMNFGIAVGILAISLRLWLSLERGSFFEREL